MEKAIDGIIKDVQKLEDVGEFLESVLDISRKQNLVGGEWQTEYYELCLAWGGPGIWMRTDGVIKGAWWGDYVEIRVENKRFRDKLNEIEEYLDEVFS